MKPKTQKSLPSAWEKFKRNGDNKNEVKLFSFENIIEIYFSSLISSEGGKEGEQNREEGEMAQKK